MSRRPLSKGKKLGFGCVTLLILLGVPEIAFRIREQVRLARKPRLPTQYDAYRGLVLVPGASYERTDQGRKMTINSLGFRGPELGPKSPDRPRVYCAGGSTTFGLYASSNETTWPARLQALFEDSGTPVETINGGAPAWTSRVSLTNLELRGFELKPDLVVVYHNWNDLISNLSPRYWKDSEAEDVEQVYRPESLPLLGRSALFRFAKSRLRDPYDQLSQKQDELSEEGIQAFERNLRRLIRRCGEEGAKVLLCTFPHCLLETEAASREAGVPDLDQWYGALSPVTYPCLYEGLGRYNAVVRAVAEDTNTTLVDLESVFPKDVALYVTPMHHSDEGEQKVAEMVQAAILEARLLDD